MAIAYFSTWTTYGTWLPGDERGWFQRGAGIKPPDFSRQLEASLRMAEDAITLDVGQRGLVNSTIAEHCAIRGWILHAANCRSNHVHVVVTAPGRPIETPREQFKSWCTRRLKKRDRDRLADQSGCVRETWWTQRGWDLYIDDEEYLVNAIAYVRDGQSGGASTRQQRRSS